MYDPALDTFLAVADCGSFLKASEKLFLSPTAVMKQMNQLEKRLGLTLFCRTSQGVQLTDAGRSICSDARTIIQTSIDAIDRARRLERPDHAVIRIGTSALYPCRVLMDLWNPASERYPWFTLKLVPSTATGTGAAFAAVGNEYDLIVGPHNSVTVAKNSRFLALGECRFCLAMPKTHPLAGRTSLSLEELHGERLCMQAPGNSPVNDRLRKRIQKEHPEIILKNVSRHYDLEVFNLCAEEGGILLSLDVWKDVHPALVSVPLQTDETVPYGILASVSPSPDTAAFLDAIRSTLRAADARTIFP